MKGVCDGEEINELTGSVIWCALDGVLKEAKFAENVAWEWSCKLKVIGWWHIAEKRD